VKWQNNGLIPGVKKAGKKKNFNWLKVQRDSPRNIKLYMYTDPIADYLTRVRNAVCKPQSCRNSCI
jgi:hypothetical protein